MHIFLQGLTMGLAYVAPIGMQNIFVINTALTQPRRRIYLTAGIVTFFDITLGFACFFGIGAVMQALPLLEKAILLIGSLVVIWIGIGLIRSKSEEAAAVQAGTKTIGKVIATAFVITWCNPQALIDGTMMLGAFNAALPAGTDLYFVSGFSLASVLWFFGMSTVVSLFREKITARVLRVINIICGLIIVVYGLKLLWGFAVMIGIG